MPMAWVGVATVTAPNAGAARPRMLEVADAAITGVRGAVFSCIMGEVRGKASATLCWRFLVRLFAEDRRHESLSRAKRDP